MRSRIIACLLMVIPTLAWSTTTITYQGELQDNGTKFDGQIDMAFELFDDFDPNDPSVGSSVAGPIAVNDVEVSNGLFQVDLDFGAVYGQPAWIEITVGTDTLHPRQRLTSAPVAVHALNVSSTAGAWMLGGNAGTDPANNFLGTTDTSRLELRVNDQVVTRIFDGTDINGHHAPNLIAGSDFNVLDESGGPVIGAIIAGGGGLPGIAGCGPNDSSPCINTVSADFATVVGGRGNYATGTDATAMGLYTTASSRTSTAMGRGTTASGDHATAMGRNTTASGRSSTAMGQSATASADYATAIGRGTTASGHNSIAMGRRARAEHTGTLVWSDSTFEDFTSTGEDQFLIRAGGGMGINENTPGTALHVTGSSPDMDAQAQIHVEGEETSGAEGTGAAIAFLGHDGNIRRRWGRILNVKENGTVGDTRSRMSFHVRGVSGLPQERVRIESDGTTVNTDGSWATFSDRRLKKDIGSINQPLDRLLSLEGIVFEYIEDPDEPLLKTGEPRMGFVAQKVEGVFPEWVRESASGFKQVSLAGFEALAVEAIRKLSSQHEEMQSTIVARDSKIRELESRLMAAEAARHELREDLDRYGSLAERNAMLEKRLLALEELLNEGETVASVPE